MARLYRTRESNHDYGSVRAGFSFYETDYAETQPWFVVEVRRMHELSDRTEITPMLRPVNKNYFIKAGVNNSVVSLHLVDALALFEYRRGLYEGVPGI